MSSKHDRTLAAIFEAPTRSDLRWHDFVALVRYHGGTVRNGKGSRRRLTIGSRSANFHEPHPGGEMKKYAVEAARAFLLDSGVRP
jgi:hypothetical protein